MHRSSSDESDSALANGIRWASRVTTVGLEFALPPCVGLYLDRYWNIAPVLTLVGAFLGFGIGMTQLMQIAREQAARSKKPKS